MVIGRRAQSAQRIAKGELAVGRLQLAEETRHYTLSTRHQETKDV
jgi:hypothetical protein